MKPERREREMRAYRKQLDLCPTHGTKLMRVYYEDLDLMTTKCRDRDCIDGHAMIENFKQKKQKRRKTFVSKKVQKELDAAADELLAEDLQAQQ